MISTFRRHPLSDSLAHAVIILPMAITDVRSALVFLGLFTIVFVKWHHANDKAAFGKNMGATFTIWDQLFGTYYMPGGRPTSFGTSELTPGDYFEQMMYPFRGIRQDLKKK